MKACLYFTYLHDPNTHRMANLAGDGVSRYLIHEFEKIFDKVWVINLENVAKNFVRQKETRFILSSKTTVISPGVFKCSRIENKMFGKLKLRRTIEKYIREFSQNDGFVFAYHSLSSTRILSELKSKFHYKLILQVEEIYSEIYDVFKRFNATELASLQLCDGFIVANNQLKAKFARQNQVCPVLLGDMRAPASLSDKIKDGKIHLVYGGTLSSDKITFNQLILPLTQLEDKYVLHVYPSNGEKDLRNYLASLDKQITNRVFIERPIIGEQYFTEISKYHIGLAINIDSPELSSSAIPSKIINYLKCNLQVVSTPLECVKQSKYADCISLSKGFSPVEIAEAIRNCERDEAENQGILAELNSKFAKNLTDLIQQIIDT